MSSTPPLTYEQMMEMFRETREGLKESREGIKELRKRSEEVFRAQKATDKQLAALGDRIGELVAAMVEGGIVRLFKNLGYVFDQCSRGMEFNNNELGIAGEVDLFLENGEYALLGEVKTNLSLNDIKDHIERMEKYRRCADFKGDKRRFLAAVGGGVVRTNVRNFALKQGLYVIQQSGENVEVIPPAGKPHLW